MASKVQDIVFSNFAMPSEVWDEEKTRIKWISLKNYDLKAMRSVVIKAIRNQSQPKNIIIASFAKFAGAVENKKLVQIFEEFVAESKAQKANKINIATCMFIPNNSAVWDKVADLNESIRLCNNIIGISPCNLHKMGMTTVSAEDLTLRVKGGCFAEFQLGLNFGINLSIEGLIRVRQHVINVFDYAFNAEPIDIIHGIKKGVRITKPPPLIETPGYNYNRFFVQELRARNLAGTNEGIEVRRSLTYSKWRPEGWKYWQVYQNDLLWNKQDRERALSEHLAKLHRSDEKPVWGKAQDEDEDEQDVIVVEIDNEYYEEKQPGDDRDVQIVERKEEAKVDKENKKENSNENQELRRSVEVNEELASQYKQELNLAKVQVSKERAAAKEWKRQVNILERDNKELNTAVSKYTRQVDVLEAQVKRMREEYKFLRDLYEFGGRQRCLKVNGRRYAYENDFDENDEDEDYMDML